MSACCYWVNPKLSELSLSMNLHSSFRHSFLAKSLLLFLVTQYLAAADVAMDISGSSLPMTALPWAGAWKFEKEWFAKQHPWLPGFLVRKILASTLILGADFYHQLDHEGRALKEKRRLVVKNLTETRAELIRHEHKNKQVHFHLERGADGHIYYVEEGLGEYRLVQGDDELEEIGS